MALPSIVLLLGFIAGIYQFGAALSTEVASSEATGVLPIAVGAALAVLAAYAHWHRFRVPITVAAGAAAGVAAILAFLLAFASGLRPLLDPLVFVAGLVVFGLAMGWDISDRARTTRRSDVAFWLHLLAAPMIIHPVFAMLGVVGVGETTVANAAIAVAIYLALAVLALAIDRRAVLVSALAYVLYATSTLFRAAGTLTESFALTALIIGAALLLLSIFWHRARQLVLGLLPDGLRDRLPAV
jgi:hypothetical protein